MHRLSATESLTNVRRTVLFNKKTLRRVHLADLFLISIVLFTGKVAKSNASKSFDSKSKSTNKKFIKVDKFHLPLLTSLELQSVETDSL